MLSYDGLITLTPILSKEELNFLQNWQATLNSIYENQDITCSPLEQFVGLDFSTAQKWAMCKFGYSPMISWSEEGMVISGSSEKGQLRGAILAYLHLLIGDKPIIRDLKYQQLSFLKSHTFNGIIESQKNDRQWLYLIEDNDFYSVNSHSAQAYLSNKDAYFAEFKEDNFLKHKDKYFGSLELYANLNKEFHLEKPNVKATSKSKI